MTCYVLTWYFPFFYSRSSLLSFLRNKNVSEHWQQHMNQQQAKLMCKFDSHLQKPTVVEANHTDRFTIQEFATFCPSDQQKCEVKGPTNAGE